MNKNNIIFIISAFAIFLVGMFVAGPWVQHNWIEPNQPYLIVDPDVKAKIGCEYDYLTHVPVEITGRDPKDGVIFPVASIPMEIKQYVHYPDSWNSPWNPYNPSNQFSTMIQVVGTLLVCLVGGAFIIYLVILWRKGTIRKMIKNAKGEE
jgi:hypothetical protein